MIVLLIKYSITIATVLLFYKIFLTKESFYKLNRLYLMITLLITFLLPFFSIPKLVSHQGIIEEYVEQVSISKPLVKTPIVNGGYTNNVPVEKEVGIEKENNTFLVMDFNDWILVVYGIGVLIFLINFMIQLIGVLALIIKNDDKIKDEGFTIINLKKFKEPCSFFNYIFIHPESYDHDTYEQIIVHEKIHSEKRHTIDLLFAEISLVLLWFFPLMWTFRKEVEKNIEYQTDELLLKNNTIDKDNYQMNLLRVAIHNKPLSLTTNYNQSLIKQRIMKMSAKKSNPLSFYKYLFVTPTLLLLLLLINKPQMVNAQSNTKQIEQVVENALNPNKKTKNNISNDIKLDENPQCQELLNAIINNNISKIKEIVKEIDVNCISGKSEYESVIYGGVEYKIMMLKTPITIAAKIGSIEVLKILIANNANLEFHEGDMKTPLLVASQYGNLEFVKYLISHGAKANKKIKEKALLAAAQNGHLNVVKHFHSQGLDINNINEKGTVLSNASRNGHLNVVEYAISNGAKINLNVPADGTALLAASRNGHVKTVEYLLSKGGKLDSSVSGNGTVLLVASSNGKLEMIKYLLSQGLDINQKYDEGTALSAASRNGHLETVKYIISKGAKINLETDADGTALIAAARNGHLETVKYLLLKGAKINSKSQNEETALKASRRNGHSQTVKYLISQGAE